MQPVLNPRFSLVVPVYGNQDDIADLVAAIAGIQAQVDVPMEAVFVVDGSPDRSLERLRQALPGAGFASTLVSLSRNFGAFAAIRVGLEHARGDVIAVMAADLQEPPELAVRFFRELEKGEHDIAFGERMGRDDPWHSKLASNLFWSLYRKTVMPAIPKGGVDIFAMRADFRDQLLTLKESNSSLLAQLFWLGGRRVFVGYERRRRERGKSGWTLRKKLRYLSDSVFSFTDLPIRLLTAFGAMGLAAAILLGAVTLVAKATGLVEVPGYSGTLLTIIFFGGLNSLGLGVVGTYAWRTFENTKQRPLALVQRQEKFTGTSE